MAFHAFQDKSLGLHHRPRIAARHERLLAVLVGSDFVFCDGFFGPLTGAFLIRVSVRVFEYDFLNASASAKDNNWTSDFGAMALFGITGNVIWAVARVMAAYSIAGSWTGSHLKLNHGSGSVRVGFLGVLILLIGKFARDTFRLG